VPQPPAPLLLPTFIAALFATVLPGMLTPGASGTAGADDAGGELRVWVHRHDRGLEAALRAFERRHPGWVLRVSMYERGLDARKLMTAIAGGDPPDLILQDRFAVGEWAARDAFTPLDDHIARSLDRQREGGPPGIDPAAFYPATWAEAQYRGRTYAVPLSTDARLLYYNVNALRRAGFVDDAGRVQPPLTWDQLLEYAAALTEYDAQGRITQLGFAPNLGNAWLYLYGWLNGGRFLSEDGKRVTLDDPRIVEALAYVRRLYDAVGGAAAVDAFVGSASGQEFDPFLTGRLAMKIDHNGFLARIAEFEPDLPFAVAPPPVPAGRPTLTWSGGHCYVIPRAARHEPTAFELIRFLVSDEGWSIQHEVNARYARSRGRGYVPDLTAQPDANRALFARFVRDDPNVPRRVTEALPVFFELLPRSRFRPVTPVGQLLWDEHVRATERVVRGDASPEAALRRGREAVQRRLDRVLSPASGTPIRGGSVVAGAAVGTVILAAMLAVAACRSARRRRFSRDQVRAAGLCLSPWAMGFLILTIGPVLASLIYSFCRYDVLHPARWAGLENYRRMFTDDPLFWRSLANTAYMLISVPTGMALGLAIALLLNQRIRGMKVYRTIFFLPSIVPLVAASILWLWVLNPNNGLVNAMLRMLGVEDTPLWLASPSWGLGAKAGMMLMSLWGAGGAMIIWLAGLQGIPRHLYEAARIDGASPLRQFVHVTLPLLTPYIFFNLVIGTIGVMQIFTQAFVMTQGGPADATRFYVLYLFENAFRYFEMGYASAMAWFLMLLILALTLVQLWAARKWVHYDPA